MESSTTVRQLAIEVPGATRLFEKAGIDYCCGGQRSLEEACTTAGVTVEEMMTLLASAESNAKTSDARSFFDMSLTKLINHIVDTHHVFTTNEIQRLTELMNKVYGVHLDNHPELANLRTLFEKLVAELTPHMMKEEQVLFPYVMAVEDAALNNRSVQTPPFVMVSNPVRMMMMEHEVAGDLLKEMRKLTSDYKVPENVCISYQTLYQALEEFEKDLHQHIHLENNILFPKAIELEKKL